MGEDVVPAVAQNWPTILVAAITPIVIAGFKVLFDAWVRALARKADRMWAAVDDDDDTKHLPEKEKTAIVRALVQPTLPMPKGVVGSAVDVSRTKMLGEREAQSIAPEQALSQGDEKLP